MALDDAASGNIIDSAETRFPLPKERTMQPGDVVSFMPAARTYTEREKVLAERAAFEDGLIRGTAREFAGRGDWMTALKRAVAEAFPLPKVTRTRVVQDPREPYDWSVREGALHFRWDQAGFDDWKRASGLYENLLLTPLPERVKLWADLLARPMADDAKDAARYRWLRDTFHAAKGGASLTVNDDLAVYQTPEPGKEVRVQWYPSTPVGFNVAEASTMDEAIDKAMRGEE
jgi:hypothetical protein